MRLNILSLQTGSRELADVSIHDTVDGLKAKLSEECLVDAQPTGLRLIHSGKTLAVGSERLSDAGVAEGDVIVVVKRRGSGDENAWKQREMNKPSPDAATIAEAMSKASLGPEEGERGDEDLERGPGLRDTDASTGRYAEGGSSYTAVGNAPQGGAGMTLPEPDAEALAQLLEMGFPEARARKALLLHRNHPGAAMEWLLEVGDGPEADADLTEGQVHHVMTSLGMRQPVLRRQREPPGVPDEAMIRSLCEMGFPRGEVLEALAATNNDHDAACAWLLGDRGVGGATRPQATRESAGEGASAQGNPESMHMLLGNILSHPTVQQGMQSERVLQAFQSMIEDPSSAHDYMNDPEVGPILLRVHSILASIADRHTGNDAEASHEQGSE